MKRLMFPVTLVLMVILGGCMPTSPIVPIVVPAQPPEPVKVPIMGRSVYNAAQLTKWYKSKHLEQAPGSCASAEDLAKIFIEEGSYEGVRGDMAFIQAMLETGWLKHSERVPVSFCNYSGIGAIDNGVGANQFPDARTGVRAQIQHLRAYADDRVTCRNFKNPVVTPRCDLVKPKGKVTTWNEMGNGNWATDPDYASKILGLFADLQTLIPK